MPAHPKPSARAKLAAQIKADPDSPIAAEPRKKAVKPQKAKPAPKAAPKAKAPATAKPAAPEGKSKTDMLIEMLSGPGGATSKEMEEFTGWAPHSVRGLLGTLRKRGVEVVSKKLKGEPTIYRIHKKTPAEPVGDVV